MLKVKLLTDSAAAPARATPGSAGYDLACAASAVVPARGKALIKTGISIALPDGCYGRVAPRSGLAWKHSIHVGAGVIDADYRGEVGVVLFNLSDTDFNVSVGDRVAQLVLERIVVPDVQVVQELSDTERGGGGFGSTTR